MSQPTQLLRLAAETAGGVTHIRFPAGRADGMASRELYETAVALVDHPPVRMLVDLTGVGYVSSGAMGMLIAVRKKFLQHGGQIHIVVADPLVRKSFQIANLHLFMPLFETVGEARAAFKLGKPA